MNPPSRKKRFIPILAALAVLGALLWAFRAQPVAVELAEVTQGPFEQTVDDDGKTRVRERYVVSAPLAGRVQRITLKAGDPVAAGAVLAHIAPSAPALLDARTERELRERLGAAESARLRSAVAIERAMAALEKSQADLNRAQQLAAKNFVSPAQREQAELEVRLNQREVEAARHGEQAARHEEAVARAALARVKEGGNGQRWAVRAPVDGFVLKVVQESEAAVGVGAALLEIGAPEQLEIVIDVLSTDAVQIAPGAPVYIERWGRSEALQGRVRRVEPAAFTKISALGVEEQRVNVIVDLTSPPEQWRALGDGYKIDARIVTARLDRALKVPLGALFRDGEQWAAYKIADGKAVKSTVQVSHRGGREAVIAEGLAAGDKVIVHPAEVVRDGVEVKVR